MEVGYSYFLWKKTPKNLPLLIPPYLFSAQIVDSCVDSTATSGLNLRCLSVLMTLWQRAFALPFILRANFQNISV